MGGKQEDAGPQEIPVFYRSYVGRIERGDNNVAILTLARLASALDMTVAKLLQRAGL